MTLKQLVRLPSGVHPIALGNVLPGMGNEVLIHRRSSSQVNVFSRSHYEI
jgi:hypothetical protein